MRSSQDTVVVFRPRRLRAFGIGFTVAICALCAFGWFALPVELRARFSLEQRLTLLLFLGVIVLILVALAASYVRADAVGLRWRNGLRTQTVTWDRVHKIMLRPGDPWAIVLIKPEDGTPFEADLDADKRQLMGIQANDGERARQAVNDLVALARASRQA